MRRHIIPTILAAGLALTAFAPAQAEAAPSEPTGGASAQAVYARPAPLEPRPAHDVAHQVAATASVAGLEAVGRTSFRVTSVAAPTDGTIWLAGTDAQQHVVVQRVTTAQRGAKVKFHAPTTLAATAPDGVQISAVDGTEAWLVTAPVPERSHGLAPAPGRQLWRYDGAAWAQVAVTLPGADPASPQPIEVRDLPGRDTAYVNVGQSVWRYAATGFTNATTTTYTDPDAYDMPTSFDYGIRPVGADFLAIGETFGSVNYLRTHGGTVTLISAIGGSGLGGASMPDAWQVLPDGTTMILGHSEDYGDGGPAIIKTYCTWWSPIDAVTSCTAPAAPAQAATALADGSVVISDGGRLVRRATPTAPDVVIPSGLGATRIGGMDAAHGSRTLWVAADSGAGSTIARYVAR